MASGTYGKVKDDFILTISDTEDNIPDLELKEISIQPSNPSITGQKRKRKAQVLDKEDATGLHLNKKAKNVILRDIEVETNGDENDEAGWDAHGEDDGTLNPNFEFSLGGIEGDLGEDLTGWATIPNNRNTAQKQVVDVDEIVGRRRKAIHDEKNDVLMETEEFSNEDSEIQDQADEEAEEEEVEDAINENLNSMHHEEKTLEDSEDGSESDEDSIAEPMPHPDDNGISSASESEVENEEENARRDAFFAADDAKDTVKSSSTTGVSFQDMSLSRPILKGLTAAGFASPTPIQSKTIPVALIGKDVVGGAVTGSGKTAAFIIPILERLLFRPKKLSTTRVAILMPTRELAVQCFNVAKKLASFTDITFALTVGGLSLRDQEQELKKKPDIVIATPGRFIDHVRNSSTFAVENLEILVLDEADRMLDDGFADELNEILRLIPRSRQTMLFSATMTQDVDKLIRVGMNRPVRLMVDANRRTVQGLVQEFIKMKGGNKDIGNRRLAYLVYLCKNVYTSKTIVFLGSKVLAHRVKVLLSWENVKAAELHGSMSQEQRLTAITSFRAGQSTHLLATDLASRGLDIPKVETVLNFTVPTTSTTYLHRVGRTARAGRVGVASTIFNSISNRPASGKAAKISERTLLKPILKLAKDQSATIRTRTLPQNLINDLTEKITSLQPEIDSILEEEKGERLMQQTERDLNKSSNMIDHAEEIASRPRRTWFQNEKEKKVASEVGKEERQGFQNGAIKKQEKKGKLSNKDKKRLRDRDERNSGKSMGWKKRSDERVGKGVLQNLKASKVTKKKSKLEKAKKKSKITPSKNSSKQKMKKRR